MSVASPLILCQLALSFVSFSTTLLFFLSFLSSAFLIFIENEKYAATQQLLKLYFFSNRLCAILLILLLVCGMSCPVLSDLPGTCSCLILFAHSCWMKRPAQACLCRVRARVPHLRPTTTISLWEWSTSLDLIQFSVAAASECLGLRVPSRRVSRVTSPSQCPSLHHLTRPGLLAVAASAPSEGSLWAVISSVASAAAQSWPVEAQRLEVSCWPSS